jgi:hypothetical protein
MKLQDVLILSSATRSAAPIPIEDAVANMRVIDALFRSAHSGHWETP